MRHFAFPLILYRQFGHDYRGDFLGDLEGVSADSVYRLAGPLRRWFPPYLFAVTVPHLLRNMESRHPLAVDAPAVQIGRRDAEGDRYILTRMVRRLHRLIERLRRRRRRAKRSSSPALAARLSRRA